MLNRLTSYGQSPPLPTEHCRLGLQQLVATAEAAAEVAHAETLIAGGGVDTDRIRAETHRLKAEAEKVGKEVERAVVETERLKAAAMMVRSEKMKIDAETERLKAKAEGARVEAKMEGGKDVAGSAEKTQTLHPKKDAVRLTVGVGRVMAATEKDPKKVDETRRKTSEKSPKKIEETRRKSSAKDRVTSQPSEHSRRL